MNLIILTYFLINIMFVFFLVNSKKVLHLFNDNTFNNPQKVHTHEVSRSGGLSYLLLGFIYFILPEVNLQMVVYLYLILLLGLMEDIFKNIKPSLRFILILMLSFICIVHIGYYINEFEIHFIDIFFKQNIFLSIFFTTIALSVAINAYNLIDGFNGLLLGVTIIGVIGLIIISNKVGMNDNAYFLIFFLINIISLLIFNFPSGKIFMGDGGAYSTGYLVGIYSIILFNTSEISAWFFAILLCYPMMELIVSFSRRILIKKKHAFSSDLNHLHSLIYLYFKRNSNVIINNYANPLTSIIIWIFYSIQLLPLFFIYNNTLFMQLNFIFCIITYLCFYLICNKVNNTKKY